MFLQEVNGLIHGSDQMFSRWLLASEKHRQESISMLMYFAHKNFQYYLSALAATAKSKENLHFALENLQDEVVGNHPRLGREFCQEIGIDIEKASSDFKKIVWGIDSMIEDRRDAIFITGFLYVAEAYAPKVMRAMMSYAREKGLQKSPYIEEHSGPTEKHHVDILWRGLISEVEINNADFTEAYEGVLAWQNMICYIFSSGENNTYFVK